MLDIERIKAARERLKGIAYQTPLEYSSTCSTDSENQVYLKLEQLQKTGSFKLRGAYTKLYSLTNEEKQRGVIAASAGNHAQGVAYASTTLGIPSTIVMPEMTSLAKVQATKRYGANVILHGESVDDALVYAKQLKDSQGFTFVHPFDDPFVIEGQGTIALELLEQLPELDAIVCAIGGGGLLSGIAYVIKQLKPSVKIYGVQSDLYPSMYQAIHKDTPMVQPSPTRSVADGIAVKTPGSITRPLIEQYTDDVVVVSENEIAKTMLHLLERNKYMVEGAGAAPLAALLYDRIPIKDQNVAVVLSGGNVDMRSLFKIIDYGLMEAGRNLKVSLTIPDRPGKLMDVLQIIAKEKGNVVTISHNRNHSLLDTCDVDVEIETNDEDHIRLILDSLHKGGYETKPTGWQS